MRGSAHGLGRVFGQTAREYIFSYHISHMRRVSIPHRPSQIENLGSQAQRQGGQKREKIALISLLTRKYRSLIVVCYNVRELST